jgi:hypothetical protein
MRKLLPCLPPLAALACLALFYLSGHPLRDGLLANADSLYLPTLFDDLLAHGGRLADWYLTPAPYFFPDWPMYRAASALAPDTYHRVLAFALLQGVVLLAALYALGRQVAPRGALPAAALAFVAFAGLAATGTEPFVLLFHSGYHFGVFMTSLLVCAAWLGWERTRGTWALAAAGILAFAATLSDSLFLLQCALPLIAACAVRAFGERDYLAGRRRAVGLLLACAIAGQLAYKVVVKNKTRYHAQMDLKHLGPNLHDLGALLARVWQDLPLVTVLWAACVAFGVVTTARLLRGRDTAGLPRALTWLIALWIFSLAASVTVSLLVYNLPTALRYFIAAACWPLVLVPLAAAHLLARHAWAALTGTAFAGGAALIFATVMQVRAHPLQRDYYPADVACIDAALAREGLHHGIAQYWDAKKLQHFSRSGMVLAQHAFDLSEIRWITSGTYFRPAYDVAIVGPEGPPPHFIPRAKLEAINGKARVEYACGQYTVLVYGKDGMRIR